MAKKRKKRSKRKRKSGLPSSIIKKYGVSKKAWKIYKAPKRSRRSKPKRRKKVKRRKKRRVYMARRRRKRRSRRRRSSGLRGLLSKDTLLMGVGAGASGALGGMVKKYIPQVPDNYAEAVAAVGLVMFGGKVHPALRTVGKGAMIKVIGDLVETNVMPRLTTGGSVAVGTSGGWTPTE